MIFFVTYAYIERERGTESGGDGGEEDWEEGEGEGQRIGTRETSLSASQA